jgi:putative NIF3 family GTP cyclohydrolase 1 type 2
LGNNRQLAEVLQIEVEGQSDEQEFLWYGKLVTPMVLSEFIEHYQECTGHKPVFFGDKEKLITTIAWCTGGAQGMLHDAIKLGVDCYISGEVSEYTMSVSDESGVAYVAGGHYVTERYGIIALTEYLNEQGFDAEFLELYNPI